jgi:hypothetical protein
MEGYIDLKPDESAENYEKKGEFGRNLAKNEHHFLLLDGKDSFFLAD